MNRLPLTDPATGLRRGAIRHPNGNPPQVLGCRWCGEFHVGTVGWTRAADWHQWTPPTEAQAAARRAARGIAAEPVPAGPDHREDHDDDHGTTWPVDGWEREAA